jgi:pimeloyl-ACP methyl ester carboxylesterase
LGRQGKRKLVKEVLLNRHSSSHIDIYLDDCKLAGELAVPPEAAGLVVFAHGSGSSRHSSRNAYVASILNAHGFGTLRFDLLTCLEDLNPQSRFDIGLLSKRLTAVTRWVKQGPHSSLPLGLFGASTGSAAALAAAANLPDYVRAVVSRGGRPDLASPSLRKVRAATLLIVGGEDYRVIELNQAAYQMLACEKQLEIVPDATHLFEEPGTLETVARLSASWFERHLFHDVSRNTHVHSQFAERFPL